MDYLIGHLVGDYLLQNDYLAQNKKSNSWICALHCLIYSFCIFVLTGWSFTSIGIIFTTHFLLDRWTFPQWYMRKIGQEKFAQPPMSPWSIVLVDNIFHVVILYSLSKFVS